MLAVLGFVSICIGNQPARVPRGRTAGCSQLLSPPRTSQRLFPPLRPPSLLPLEDQALPSPPRRSENGGHGGHLQAVLLGRRGADSHPAVGWDPLVVGSCVLRRPAPRREREARASPPGEQTASTSRGGDPGHTRQLDTPLNPAPLHGVIREPVPLETDRHVHACDDVHNPALKHVRVYMFHLERDL